ncbi:hypothetical protein DYB32_003348 [Aphanomyces invadans]|uniref:Uncharacterized protein n=1 Tax=Aphanomyces invadans TaxID=157072 RepID=A0A3R6VZR2_9STRA|nr:hypothetical protein DYB32_003348 [Aphanomyces invadans]
MNQVTILPPPDVTFSVTSNDGKRMLIDIAPCTTDVGADQRPAKKHKALETPIEPELEEWDSPRDVTEIDFYCPLPHGEGDVSAVTFDDDAWLLEYFLS